MKANKKSEKEKKLVEKFKGFAEKKNSLIFSVNIYNMLKILLVSFIILGFAGFGTFVGIAKGILTQLPC